MFEIIEKKALTDHIIQMHIKAPDVCKHAKAGQFVILRVNEQGERIPLTIADVNKDDGLITIIFQVVGKTTYLLSQKQEKAYIQDFVGPLGEPTQIEGLKKVLVISGGVGSAIAYPLCKALFNQQTHVDLIAGFKTKDEMILMDAFHKVTHKRYVTTDDGSFGAKGFVTDILKDILEKESYDHVFTIVPNLMMKAVSELTKIYEIPTTVSLNPIMVDGTGMCGGCRVKIGEQMKFACVDGPDFDGHLVDFDNLIKRNQMYKNKELKDYHKVLSGGL